MAAASSTTGIFPYPTDHGHLANPYTPPFSDAFEFVEAYLYVRVSSFPSRWYSYLLWIAIAGLFILLTLFHQSGIGGGFLGAYWNKWALRRRTWRKRHAQLRAWTSGKPARPYVFPPNGQLLTLVAIFVVTLGFCFIGPDYIKPRTSIFHWRREILHTADGMPFKLSEFEPWVPQYTIQKAWWTLGNRTGIIAFSLFPLVILFGIKQAPFALFANSWTMQIHFDKLVWLHRWTGRFTYFVTLLHVIFWSVQLFLDHAPNGDIAYKYAWLHQRFVLAWVGFAFFTLMMLGSIPYIRTNYYEWFYAGHILFVPGTLIFASTHHPQIGEWCWIALGLWLGERAYRLTRWIRINTPLWSKPVSHLRPLYSAPSAAATVDPDKSFRHSRDFSTLKPGVRDSVDFSLYRDHVPRSRVAYAPPPGFARAQILSGRTIRLTITTPGHFPWAPGQHFIITVPSISKVTSHPFTCASVCDQKAPGDSGRVLVFLIRAKGGFTKRLWDTVTTLGTQLKANVPSETLPPGTKLPESGVLLKTWVDGPFGSAARARWGSYSTVILVAGGSGVSFACAVLEYICLCWAGREGKELGGQSSGWGGRSFVTNRIRFLWIVREFAHIQWCASALRRCLNMVPPEHLQIDIFITNFKTLAHERKDPDLPARRKSAIVEAPVDLGDGEDKKPLLSAEATRPAYERGSSFYSVASRNESVESFVDMNPITPNFGDEDVDEADAEAGHENFTLDLTNFDGEDDSALPGEEKFSARVQKAGKMRRAKTRKAKQLKQTPGTEGSEISPIPADAGPASADLLTPDAAMHSTRRGRSPSPLPGGARHLRSASSTDLKTLASQGGERGRSPSPLPSGAGGYARPAHHRADSAPFTPGSAGSRDTRYSRLSGVDWDAESMHSTEYPPGSGPTLEVEEDELEDVHVVSECARPGKPKLERIFAFEAENSSGATIVGCCGPSSLNAIIRKAVAKQIKPDLVRKGDLRGQLTLASEEFSY